MQLVGLRHGIEGLSLLLGQDVDDRGPPGDGGELGVAGPSLIL